MPTKKKFGPISSQFVDSTEKPSKYKFCLGKCFASSLSGFLAGLIVACLVWLFVVDAFFK
jgi:hypothetical protein